MISGFNSDGKSRGPDESSVSPIEALRGGPPVLKV